MISIREAAAEAGLSIGEYVSQLAHSGLLMLCPDEPSDPRCEAIQQRFPGHIRWHVDDCECRFIPSPHPDIRPI